MLPNDKARRPLPPQRWRLSIGETIRDASGKTRPGKLDYFQVRKLIFDREKGSYVLDVPTQEAISRDTLAHLPPANAYRAGAQENKPRAVRVRLLANPYIQEVDRGDGTVSQVPTLPPLVAYTSMARFASHRRVCYCDQFGVDGTGFATLKSFEKRGEVYIQHPPQVISCNPATCPFATGVGQEGGRKTCKPQVIYTVTLPGAPELGAVARVHTTSWYSEDSMYSSLILIAHEPAAGHAGNQDERGVHAILAVPA